MEIHISNSAGRDAAVSLEGVSAPLRVRWVDAEGRQASAARVIKCTVSHDLEELRRQAGDLEKVASALVEGDPEVDIERIGGFLRETSRVFLDGDRRIVHKVNRWEVLCNPDGSVRERRQRNVAPPNINTDVPLRWSGVMIKRDEACRRFVFSTKFQLVHINGLTYDFLYGMARELESQDSLMLLGAGPKSNQPLIIRRGGSPYRGFLEGRTDGDRYRLMLHLSNLELKRPPSSSDKGSAPAEQEPS